MIARTPQVFQDIVSEHIPKWEPDGATADMCFDAGLLWGQAFLAKFPQAKWSIGKPPKLSFDFQYPVIVGVEDPREEFNPLRSFFWSISDIIEGEAYSWTLSSISVASVESLKSRDIF